jgi:anti-sigma regulatory factor (Ser/Thr protein kinase)
MEVRRKSSVVLPVNATDSSHIGHARRQAIAMASAMGFSELTLGELAIIVTEAAANITAHATQGEIVLSSWQFRGDSGIDVLALDNGRGIADIGRSFQDGYSTAGTAGQGLGAMFRLSSALQIYSLPDKGTALFARVVAESPSANSTAADYSLGAISTPMNGETACGDAWSAAHSAGRSLYMVADGLGHGPSAAVAAQEAIRIFEESSHLTPTQILSNAHGALAKTRGAAVSVAEINYDKRLLNYAGVGNIAGSILHDGKTRSMISMNGTLGHTIGKIQQFSYPWETNSSLIMHSDGLSTRWSLDQFPGLATRHPALLAGVLYRDFCRRRDDVTILVTRI